MKKKIRFTLGKKTVLMVLTMSVILCATALFISYRTYHARTTAFYEQLGYNVVKTLASQLDPKALDQYYETQTMDEQYYKVQDFIADLVESSEVEYLYVVRPHGVGVTFLFDSDMETGENGDYASGGYCALGTYTDLVGSFAENLDRLLEGESVEPIVQKDPSYGWMMTVMVPVLHENGTMAAYVMADFNLEDVVQEEQQFLFSAGSLLLILTVVFAVLYLALIRRYFVQPVQQLTQAAQSYEGGENKRVFSGIKIRGNDELKTLADAFRMMLVEIEINNMEQQELALREQRLDSELQLANELNVSMLPKILPEREGGYPFDVQGSIRQGQELSCCFYDYFLLDRDQLCILVGEVPGEGVPQVLYTAMAQATIKSQMRSGLPLTEAVTAAGRQLHELSESLYLHVLVGILNGTTGQFTCINAGLPRPLLMRGEDRYEWIKALSYAPLGQSENVVYQVLELQLRQGDRLFFHTEGLDEIEGTDGRTFGEEQLRLALNGRQSRQGDLAGQLRYINDAGTAYAERSGQIRGYAILGLEYRRRDRAQAHCVLTPDGPGSQRLLEFLRGQLSENEVESQRMAEVMVLADELFALCRRCAAPDSRFLAECAIPAGEDLLVLRLKGDMGGRDPLKELEGGAACHAVEFLTKYCEQVLFEHGDSVDIVTMVRRLRRESEGRHGRR